MVKEGIVLGHKISKNGLEVDRAKVDVIAKLPPPTTVKGVRSFLGHAGFYRRFIQDFSKIARPMTHLLEKDTPFVFSDEYLASFKFLKKRLTEAPILVSPDWDLLFELMDVIPAEKRNSLRIFDTISGMTPTHYRLCADPDYSYVCRNGTEVMDILQSCAIIDPSGHH
ncbi:hypothetical protein Tco_1229514 [Tanacetum coccineum]